ncbi:MAG: UDP-glucose/GDP-mannose dehydrogenase family protein [Patescibacteria group bacterium]|jgi:UDPglucose 6-dehydrogenase
MRIAVIGVGYVGLVSGTCLAELGHQVVAINNTAEKVIKLKSGIIPIYEPGLERLVKKNVKAKRLIFTTDYAEGIKDVDVVFICVGTPSMPDGRADLSQVKAAAKSVAQHLKGYAVIADKSTVPVGTAEVVRGIVKKNHKGPFDVVSTPEFLREGFAVEDFFKGDRVVIGVDSQKAERVMLNVFKKLKMPKLVTSIPSAEMIKYASNAFLATKISFINEIANVSEEVGADVEEVAEGMGLDQRIGHRFLKAGIGYGGSCFPKDVRALDHIALNSGYDFQLVRAVIEVNNRQRQLPVKKLLKRFSSLNGNGKIITVFGLAFKNNTDDVRESSAISIIQDLVSRGAKVRAYDPVAAKNAERILGESIQYFTDPYEAAKGAQAAVIATEWEEFITMDWKKIKRLMKKPILIDGKNLLDGVVMNKLGFDYEGIGKPQT